MSEPLNESSIPSSEGGAFQVGEILREARERRGESVAEAAQALKLTLRQVEAMETGRLDLLPGPAFARGFLRNYARHLGLDPAAVMAAMEQPVSSAAVELSPVSNAEGVMPADVEGKRTVVPAALVAVVLLVVVAAGWYFDWFEAVPGRAPVTAPGTPEGPVPVQPSAAEAPGGQSSAAAEPAVPPPTLPPAAEPSAGAPQVAAPPISLPPPPAAETIPQPAQVAPPAAASADPVSQPAAPVDAAEQLQFRFDGEAWVEVRDANGRILHSGVNRPGSTRVVQGQPPFKLVVGNAGQVHLEYNGAAVDLTPHTRVNVARLTVK